MDVVQAAREHPGVVREVCGLVELLFRGASQLRMCSPRAVCGVSILLAVWSTKVSLASQPSSPRKQPSNCADQESKMAAVSAIVAWCGRCPESPVKRCPPHCSIQDRPHCKSFVWLCHGRVVSDGGPPPVRRLFPSGHVNVRLLGLGLARVHDYFLEEDDEVGIKGLNSSPPHVVE